MSNQDDEIERLQRLRDRQLSARDPSEKRERYGRQYRRQRSARKAMTFKEVIATFPHKWRGLFIGFLVGLLAWFLIATFVEAAWVDLAGLLVLVVCCAAGLAVGASFDWRDDLRDF